VSPTVAQILSAAPAERSALLERVAAAPLPIAYALKDACYALWSSDPAQAVAAARALHELAALTQTPEVDALAAWTGGIAALTQGAMEEAIQHLDAAAAGFVRLAQEANAAATQVSKLIALAMLGRYDEAVACGLQARETFLATGDLLSAGKIAQNLGTIAWRRDRYQEAEAFHRAAQRHFALVDAVELLIAAENGLANAVAAQYRGREAMALYQHALARAEQSGLALRQAEIECNLGNLALAQGQYDQALAYLERSRRRYSELAMPHESAYAEQELAEAYLALNMAQEAATIYARVTPTFAALGLRMEQAWALAHHGQAALLLHQPGRAAELFAAARALFAAEANPLGAAITRLYEAQLADQRADYTEAITAAHEAETIFSAAASHGRALLARFVRGEALRKSGAYAEAEQVITATLAAAETHRLPQIAQRCYTARGMIQLAQGNPQAAERALRRAAATLEALRAPLPSDEIRTAFVADKLGPYAALIAICLASDPPRITEALAYAERARAHALAELLGRSVQLLVAPHDASAAHLVDQATALREELNWLYQQANQASSSNEPTGADPAALYANIEARETTLHELHQQLQLRSGALLGDVAPLDLSSVRQDLGTHTALISYTSINQELIAFVITDQSLDVVRNLGAEVELNDLIERLRFQIETIRHSPHLHSTHAEQLQRRVHHYLQRLHAALIAPLTALLGTRRLVFVPHQALHYVPFHALYDGTHYLIEQHECCTAPSLSVLQHCLRQPTRARQRAVLVGVPDAHAPHVHAEVTALAPLFADPVVLLGAAATSAAVHQHAPHADLLHLACHGSFRPDNPLFSALHLADGRLIARDAYMLDLKCDLVVLSACETGSNTIAPGDELIGLARGFFAAGAAALLVSLWTVDDASTATLMIHFYQRLQAGDTPAAALRSAQCALIRTHPHPFYWAPFVLMGRW
jgi:CHAT domain-containing protein